MACSRPSTAIVMADMAAIMNRLAAAPTCSLCRHFVAPYTLPRHFATAPGVEQAHSTLCLNSTQRQAPANRVRRRCILRAGRASRRGGALKEEDTEEKEEAQRAAPMKPTVEQSSSLPFGQHVSLHSFGGPVYTTAQTIIQQVAYSLSDKLFVFSLESFDLDVAANDWSQQLERNAFGDRTDVACLQTRTGAGSIALGYTFSSDFDPAKRHVPHSIFASSATVQYLRQALNQFSLLYSLVNPTVAHIAAVDYYPDASSSLVTDYVSSLAVADDLGLGLVCSPSVYEAQHMALFATLLSKFMPTLHTFDGIYVGRETARVVDTMDQSRLYNSYRTILGAISVPEKKPSNAEWRVMRLLDTFNDEFGVDYHPFEYHGHQRPDQILVVFGSVEASISAQVADALAMRGCTVGVINVRVYRPFIEDTFLRSVPRSAQKIGVLGQVADEAVVLDSAESSLLYASVLAAVQLTPNRTIEVTDLKYSTEQAWTPESMLGVFHRLVGEDGSTPPLPGHVEILDTEKVQQYSFWSLEEAPATAVSMALGQLLASDSSQNVFTRTSHDNLVLGGVIRTDLRRSAVATEAPFSVQDADFTLVADHALLGSFDILRSVKTGSSLILLIPGFKDGAMEQILGPLVRRAIRDKDVRLFVLDPERAVAVTQNSDLKTHLTQAAAVQILGLDPSKAASQLAELNGSDEALRRVQSELPAALREIDVSPAWGECIPEKAAVHLPLDLNVNGFSKIEHNTPSPATLRPSTFVAQGLTFKEAYAAQSTLRPDSGVKAYTVHVKEHRRLTPLDYDRNVFHIEFDLGSSGLEYAIGEALGIHAENDRTEVEEFIKWYGLDPDQIVQVPSRENANVLVNRTVYQSLLQNVDIFGRPPKRFYEALAEFAADDAEKKELLTLGGPEGAVEFKRRADVDTITYADILLDFRSARPSFHDVIRLVNPTKRREYSIASSQHVTPSTVSLLIVTVNWVDPKGRDRFGQATRYLNGLSVGAPVVVSVKPSVMKLPTSPSTPLLLAGLGTGLAPFRAFLQERAFQKQQGQAIGPVLLYLGSRHQREEYLYGEEWEAYRDAGIISLLGCAFSRDQKHKVYIQDRMRQSLEEIRKAYLKDQGCFYLCGPTWPVPDVTEVLVDAIQEEDRLMRQAEGNLQSESLMAEELSRVSKNRRGLSWRSIRSCLSSGGTASMGKFAQGPEQVWLAILASEYYIHVTGCTSWVTRLSNSNQNQEASDVQKYDVLRGAWCALRETSGPSGIPPSI